MKFVAGLATKCPLKEKFSKKCVQLDKKKMGTYIRIRPCAAIDSECTHGMLCFTFRASMAHLQSSAPNPALTIHLASRSWRPQRSASLAGVSVNTSALHTRIVLQRRSWTSVGTTKYWTGDRACLSGEIRVPSVRREPGVWLTGSSWSFLYSAPSPRDRYRRRFSDVRGTCKRNPRKSGSRCMQASCLRESRSFGRTSRDLRYMHTDTLHTSFFSCTVHVFNDVRSHHMAQDEPRLKCLHARVTPSSCHP